MSSPNGYNNPAYCHQYDSSLYDYEYVPEIDPESPNLSEANRRKDQTKLVHPNFDFREDFSGTSDEFDNSDDSNRSVIVEECNNRRITMICEKRSNQNEYKTANVGYYQDVSLETEAPPRSLRHQRKLNPPVEKETYARGCHKPSYEVNSKPHDKCNPYPIPPRPQRVHRYEELPELIPDDRLQAHPGYQRSVHRYAEISMDENGYPSLEKEVRVERDPRDTFYRGINFSPTFNPSQTYQRTISPHPPDYELRNAMYTSSPLQNIEMSELSPPRASPTFFQRQPPIGASSPGNLQESNLHRLTSRIGHSVPNSPRRIKEHVNSPSKSEKKNPVTHIFQIKSKIPKSVQIRHPTRRNISSSFTDPIKSKTPYQPTTSEMPRTAIITPIFHRKQENAASPRKNFEKTSQIFQSTGNILAEEGRSTRIKRNQSVPNFKETFGTPKKCKEFPSTPKKERKIEYQYSPTKSMDRFSPIDRSRLSLIDQSKSSWSNLGSDLQAPAIGCLLVAAIVQLVTGIASCAISFYLLSKIGRRYYLDFGVLASFVSLILGALGFRSHCWRWLPNRNYVSGYIVLAAFSIFTCGGLVFLLTAKPMSGDPLLDMAGGAICGVSVLTILMAFTGLTMSGCCKAPPPDNRVNNI